MRPYYNPHPALTPARDSVCRAIWLAVLLFLAGTPAHAAVGVILNESLDTSVARITGSGHSAVYLSHVCPESPIRLRLCRAGEQGSVISNYTTLGEDQPYEWNVVPLSIYLYGVENPRYRPMFGSAQIKRLLEERYRSRYLADYCEGESCRTSKNAEWREMVGATLERSMYMFVIDTTRSQDKAFIEDFNSAPNENHFNGVTRNCADFTRRIVNSYFPHATKADYINDFGMTSPKAVARSFSHYARRHPESDFRVYHFAQLPGTIKRSTPARTGTEQLYRSKKLLLPMLAFAPHELSFFAASYLLTGHFNPQRQLEKYPAIDAAEIKAGDVDQDAVSDGDRAAVVGTPEQWKQYRRQFESIVDDAMRTAAIPQREYLSRVLKRLDETGTPVIDDNGALWLESAGNDEGFRVGLSADNIFASGSDPQLAYGLILARAAYVLKAPTHGRESMAEFQNDWSLLEMGRARTAESMADSGHLQPRRLASASGGR